MISLRKAKRKGKKEKKKTPRLCGATQLWNVNR